MHSESERDHLTRLENKFLKCRSYVISLNPRNSNFAMKEGKLLGHITSKDGVIIDQDEVYVILKVEETKSKKEVLSFVGEVNFLRILSLVS